MYTDDKKLVLIDGNALMHRAYHGVNRGFVPTYNGMPVGMVYGFASTLLGAIAYLPYTNIVVTFDTKEKTFRHEMDESYKAHREKAPDDFYPQLPYIDEMLDAARVQTLRKPGYESDDIIGTLAVKAEKEGWDVSILSGDLDFLQLVSEKVKLHKFNGRVQDAVIYGPKETEARYGVTPDQIIDFKALVGDSSDNYKGLPGVGPKTAANLLQEYKTIDGVYGNLEKLPEKIRQKCEDHKDYLMHCQKLAALHTDVDVVFDPTQKYEINENELEKFFEKMNFFALRNRLLKMNNKSDQSNNNDQKKRSNNSSEEEQMSLF